MRSRFVQVLVPTAVVLAFLSRLDTYTPKRKHPSRLRNCRNLPRKLPPKFTAGGSDRPRQWPEKTALATEMIEAARTRCRTGRRINTCC